MLGHVTFRSLFTGVSGIEICAQLLHANSKYKMDFSRGYTNYTSVY